MICQECGMVLYSTDDYHPYAACLMFKACWDGEAVRDNLAAVRASGAENNPDSTRLQSAEELLTEANRYVKSPDLLSTEKGSRRECAARNDAFLGEQP